MSNIINCARFNNTIVGASKNYYIYSIVLIFRVMKLSSKLLGFFILVASASCFAGPPPPPGGGGGPICWPPPCIPIDGGISLLIAAGVIYGSSKLYSKKNTKI